MKIIKYTALILLLTGFFASCDSFLDRQPDEALNEEKIFMKRATTEQYLYHVYSYVPDEWNAGDNQGWIPASDEAKFGYSRGFTQMNNGAWNVSAPPYAKWAHYYRGIREATYFMSKVDLCPELRAEEKTQYKTEARFLRAFYYYQLMRMYGPVIITGDVPVDITNADLSISRSSWDETVKYICEEMWAVSQILPKTIEDQMWYGKPTKGAALAIRSIVKLYDASPLYNNPDRSKYIYGDLKNHDGTPLFPQSYDF